MPESRSAAAAILAAAAEGMIIAGVLGVFQLAIRDVPSLHGALPGVPPHGPGDVLDGLYGRKLVCDWPSLRVVLINKVTR